jgi:hypothetical protein
MFRCVCSLLLMGLFALPVSGQRTIKSCQVEVTSPKPGDIVGQRLVVEGKAKISSDDYLWVLVHLKVLPNEWWPQGGGPASIDPKTREWMILATFGNPQDVGLDFEIAVAIVDANTNRRLNEWYRESNAKNDYPPIEFPSTVDACPPLRLTVKKTSH